MCPICISLGNVNLNHIAVLELQGVQTEGQKNRTKLIAITVCDGNH